MLDKWTTSVVFSLLGVFACFAVTEITSYMTIGAYLISGLAFTIIGLVYAIKVFPSLSGDKPILRSNEGISFLNFFIPGLTLGLFGGAIFGAIWNYSLTYRELGASRWVFTAIISAMLLWALWMLYG